VVCGRTERVVDLRTGQFREGRQADNITMSTGCALMLAQVPVWLKTVSAIFLDDVEMIDWMHRLCGMLAPGQSGSKKSVLVTVWERTVRRYCRGDYAAPGDIRMTHVCNVRDE